MLLFLSTPSARRATSPVKLNCSIRSISIHALREEGDNGDRRGFRVGRHFYPRPPRGGRRCTGTKTHGGTQFLSTPSARRATSRSYRPQSRATHFYPRPPRGGRPICRRIYHTSVEFLSTPSARRATVSVSGLVDAIVISIHALREEGDDTALQKRCNDIKFLSTPSARRATLNRPHRGGSQKNFYPRPPRGGRLPEKLHLDRVVQFLSTPSARRATPAAITLAQFIIISIHALREEGDSSPPGRKEVAPIFLSTPSARRATSPFCRVEKTLVISIHALREEGDCWNQKYQPPYGYFYPRPPRGGRPTFKPCCSAASLFLSTPSARRATIPRQRQSR